MPESGTIGSGAIKIAHCTDQFLLVSFPLLRLPLLANECIPAENYQLYVPESAQVGKPVGKIKANDEDLGINADIKYSIINSEGANTFSISADRDTKEGIISLKKVRILDFC